MITNTYSPKVAEFLVRSRSFIVDITKKIVDKRDLNQDYEEEFFAGVEVMEFINLLQDPFNNLNEESVEQLVDYYAMKHGMRETVINLVDPLNTRYGIKTIVFNDYSGSSTSLPEGQGVLVRDSLGLRFRTESSIIDQGTIDDL